jgi:hypothetical protein
MNVQQGSTATLRESAFDGDEGGGILVSQESTLEIHDVAVSDLGARGTIGNAPAVESRRGCTVTVRGLHVERASGAAMLVGEDGVLDVADAVLLDTRPSMEDDGGGLGVSVEGTGTLRLARVLFDGMHRGGIVARDGTTLVASDLVVRNVEPSGPRNLGLGMSLFGAATLDRVVVENASLEGVAVSGDVASLDGRDIVIRGTRTEPVQGYYGRGFEVNLAARATVDRLVVTENHELGVFAIDPGSTATLTNVVIEKTTGEECLPECAVEGAYGYGLSVIRGASMDITGFRIAESALVAVQVAETATLRGARGELRDAPIGVNVQAATFDLATGFTDVELVGIERNFEGDTLPIPASGFER